MFRNNNLIATTLAQFAKFTPIPDQLFKTKLIVWDQDINEDNEWDDFIAGQKVMHLEWAKERQFNGFVMLNSLSNGNSANTFQGMYKFNETLTIMTKELINVTEGLVTIGNDTEKLYFASSYPIVNEIEGTTYNGIVVLMEFNAFLNQNFEDSTQGYYSNIRQGKYGETIKVPMAIKDKFDNITDYKAEEITIPKPTYIEWMLNEPSGLLGLDAIDTNGNKWVDPTASLKPKTFPINETYSIVPTQFDLWAIDNYGIAHPGDMTNAIKAISFTKDISNVVATGAAYKGSSATSSAQKAAISNGASLITNGISGASKFMGDARELSSETAITSSFLDGENTLLKMFIQPITERNAWQGSDINNSTDAFQTLQNKNAIANITGLLENQSTLPNADILVDFGTSVGTRFAGGTKYNIVGGSSLINLSGNKQYKDNQVLPFLKAPYSVSSNFKTTDNDIANYLSIGVPRRNINIGKKLAPPHTPRTWTLGFRWNGFRPSPYTWINYPILYPSQMSIYDVDNKGYSVGYNKPIVKNDIKSKANREYWSKGIMVSDVTNKNFINPKDVFTSGTIDLTNENTLVLDKLDLCAITSSPFIVKLYASEQDAVDGNDPIDKYTFKTQGLRTGTSANWFTRIEL